MLCVNKTNEAEFCLKGISGFVIFDAVMPLRGSVGSYAKLYGKAFGGMAVAVCVEEGKMLLFERVRL